MNHKSKSWSQMFVLLKGQFERHPEAKLFRKRLYG